MNKFKHKKGYDTAVSQLRFLQSVVASNLTFNMDQYQTGALVMEDLTSVNAINAEVNGILQEIIEELQADD